MTVTLEWLEQSPVFAILLFVTAGATIAVTFLDTGFSGRDLSVLEIACMVILAVLAGILLNFALFGLFSYLLFIPSASRDAHVLSRVHGAYLVHPLLTSLVLGLLALCVYTGSVPAFQVWGVLLLLYVVQTAFIVRRIRREPLAGEMESGAKGLIFILLNLMLGGELVTMAAGAKPLPPWKLNTLPQDTWIVDVRTKPEYHWNRMEGAENYPWGKEVIEAAKDQPKDRPVLVTCFSGHRSPAVAVALKRHGFETVYNLNWGIIYLMLVQRRTTAEGTFALTRPHRDPHRRGDDLTAITHGHVSLIVLTLIGAPLQAALIPTEVPLYQTIIGAVLGLGGLALGMASRLSLGRNFRVYAAPRRSGVLVSSGVYSVVRHPMYTAVVTGLAGYIILFGSFYCVPLWLGCTLLYIIKGIKEERILADRFPEYEEYRRRTWRYVPYVH